MSRLTHGKNSRGVTAGQNRGTGLGVNWGAWRNHHLQNRVWKAGEPDRRGGWGGGFRREHGQAREERVHGRKKERK